MPLYPFETQLAVSAINPEVVMQSSHLVFYDPSDTARVSPLALLDVNGQPRTNPVTTSAVGLVPAFQASIPHVMWTDGTYSGYLSSYRGMLDEAIAARQAAQASALAAGSVLPTGATEGQYLSVTGGVPYWRTLTSSGTGGSGRVDYAIQTGSTLPARPTPDPTIVVMWIGWTEPARITSGTGGAMPNDIWIRRDAP
jgi:hypothetical protein